MFNFFLLLLFGFVKQGNEKEKKRENEERKERGKSREIKRKFSISFSLSRLFFYSNWKPNQKQRKLIIFTSFLFLSIASKHNLIKSPNEQKRKEDPVWGLFFFRYECMTYFFPLILIFFFSWVFGGRNYLVLLEQILVVL